MSKKDMGNRILWAARLMAFLFIVLLVIVSLNSLSGSESLSPKLPGQGMRLLPALSVLLVLLVYWRNTFSAGSHF